MNIMSSSKAGLAVLIMSMSIVSIVYANKGPATFYTDYVPSACYGNKDNGVKIAAASDAFWNKGAACGSYYKVTCTGAANDDSNPCNGGSVVVKIVDYCPHCQGTIDLSEDAFAAIADTNAGVIKVQFDKQ